MSRTNKKNLIILLGMIVVFFALTMGLISLYYTDWLTVGQARILQAVYYLLMAGASLWMMRISDYRFKDFGVFFFSLGWQLVMGLALGAVFTLIGVFATGGYTWPSDWLYLVPSQILVGIAEELFWRGLLLKLMGELLHSKRKAVPINAILFGCWHYPLSRSVITVILTAFIGLVFAAVRVENDEQMGLPGLAFAHSIMNIF